MCTLFMKSGPFVIPQPLVFVFEFDEFVLSGLTPHIQELQA